MGNSRGTLSSPRLLQSKISPVHVQLESHSTQEPIPTNTWKIKKRVQRASPLRSEDLISPHPGSAILYPCEKVGTKSGNTQPKVQILYWGEGGQEGWTKEKPHACCFLPPPFFLLDLNSLLRGQQASRGTWLNHGTSIQSTGNSFSFSRGSDPGAGKGRSAGSSTQQDLRVSNAERENEASSWPRHEA